MDDLKSVRCKACDSLFATVWIPERGEHEELCRQCLTAAFVEVLDDLDIPEEITEAYRDYASDNGEVS